MQGIEVVMCAKCTALQSWVGVIDVTWHCFSS